MPERDSAEPKEKRRKNGEKDPFVYFVWIAIILLILTPKKMLKHL